jgi:hypothetical protein
MHRILIWPDIQPAGKSNAMSGRIPDIKKRPDYPTEYPVHT